MLCYVDLYRARVVRVDITSPGPPSSWADVIPQHPKHLLQSAVALKGDALVVRHLADVKAALALHKLSSGERVQVRPDR